MCGHVFMLMEGSQVVVEHAGASPCLVQPLKTNFKLATFIKKIFIRS